MNSKLWGSSPRRGEGPESPSSRSEIRRIRIRSRTITTASWSDCFSQWQWQRQKQRGRWGRGHEWGHGGGCRWWCRMIQDGVRLFTQIFPKCSGVHCIAQRQLCYKTTWVFCWHWGVYSWSLMEGDLIAFIDIDWSPANRGELLFGEFLCKCIWSLLQRCLTASQPIKSLVPFCSLAEFILWHSIRCHSSYLKHLDF